MITGWVLWKPTQPLEYKVSIRGHLFTNYINKKGQELNLGKEKVTLWGLNDGPHCAKILRPSYLTRLNHQLQTALGKT